MTINLILAMAVLAAAFLIGIFRNVGMAFVFVYLPALLFCRPIEGYMLKGGLPDLKIANAAVVGMMGAMLFRFWRAPRIHWNLIDLIILAATACAFTSAVQNGTWHTGYNELLKQTLGWLVPYFIARYAFRDVKFRTSMLWVLTFIMIVLGMFAFIECRLWPHFYDMKLGGIGLKVGYNLQATSRGGFFRAETSFEHPIFFGDACVSIGCLILLLASTLKGWFRPLPLLGVVAAGGGMLSALSFGPVAGGGMAGGILVCLWLFSFTRYLLPVGVLTLVVGMGFLTQHMANADLPDRPKDESINDSFWVRRFIVHQCWPVVQDAGAFGIGLDDLGDEMKKVKVDSVDNAYVLFLMARGYVYSGLWVMIPLVLSIYSAMALIKTKNRAFIFPIAVGTGNSIGISFAFYFVWAGWAGEPYTMLWLIATAFTMSLCDACFEAIKTERQAYAAFPVVQPGNSAFPFPVTGDVGYPVPHGVRVQT